MERTIIVTDLTRFRNQAIVCMAGVDPTNGECIRPMPYLAADTCRKLNILPGAILKGEFAPAPRKGPHQEDYSYKELTFHGASTSSEFRAALLHGLFPGVEDGFELELQNQKHVPIGHGVPRSLITVRVDPSDIEIVEDRFEAGKVKLNFTDGNGRRFRFIGITDLGFYDFAQGHHVDQDLAQLNRLIRCQEDVLLRIGLSRSYKAQDGREGYWIQANGIYSFPSFNREIRSYT